MRFTPGVGRSRAGAELGPAVVCASFALSPHFELGAHERGQCGPGLRLEPLEKLRQMLAHDDERVALLGRPRDVLALGRAPGHRPRRYEQGFLLLKSLKRNALRFQPSGRRTVTGSFDAGRVSSDGGVVLLREVEEKTKVIEKLASCFTDHRDRSKVEHSVLELLAQRLYGLACGYEDLNDHDTLRDDPVLAHTVGKRDLSMTL